MRIRALFFIGIFMLIFLLSGCSIKNNGTNSTITPTPTPTPILNIIDTQIPDIKIILIYPDHMIISRSYIISVSLAYEAGSLSTLKKTLQKLEQATMVVTGPTPVGTPGATVRQAFGQAFFPSATATLNAGTFKVLSTPIAEIQGLDQSIAEWDWNVTPQSLGTQILNVDITFKWEFNQSTVIPVAPRLFRIGNPILSVDVMTPTAPPVAPTLISILSQFLNYVIQNGLSIVGIFSGIGAFSIWMWNQRRKKVVVAPAPDNLPPNISIFPTKDSSPAAKDESDDKKTS